MAKIAIIENNPELLGICARYLSSLGHEIVYRATKGREAIVKNRANPAEIILISESIRRNDAEQTVQKIHQDSPETKFIYVAVDNYYESKNDDRRYKFSIPSDLHLIQEEIEPRTVKNPNPPSDNCTEPIDYEKRYNNLVKALHEHFGDMMADDLVKFADKMY